MSKGFLPLHIAKAFALTHIEHPGTEIGAAGARVALRDAASRVADVLELKDRDRETFLDLCQKPEAFL